MSEDKKQTDGEVLTREHVETKEPHLYQVILLNDDYTTMEFVVMILETIFKKNHEESKGLMLAIHEKGSAVAGVYTKEIAETKIATVHALAKQNEFPLKCAMEPNL